MLHGCQKKVIHLRSTGSELFDEAIFILREKTDREPPPERDMVREATRILLSARTEKERARAQRRRRRLEWIVCFGVGVLFGAAFFLLAF